MKFIIDTHCWLWCFLASEKLNTTAQKLVRDRFNSIVFSAVSTWEIVIKYASGKLGLPLPSHEYIPQRLSELRMDVLVITQAHVLQVANLPLHHRDPFDRLLVAQAQVEGLPILTADPKLKKYDVEIIWAAALPKTV